MAVVRAYTVVAFLLLVLNVTGINCDEVNGYSSARSKRSLTTICVEIKPSGPQEEPYYMCRGSEFPAFPNIPTNGAVSPQYGNTDGSNQSANKQVSPPYVQNGNYGASNINQGHGNSGINAYHFAGQKNSNRYAGPVATFHAEVSNENGSGGGSSGSIKSNFKAQFGGGGPLEGVPKHAPSTAYQKPGDQYQQHYSTAYGQPHPQSQQQHPYHPQQLNSPQSQSQQVQKYGQQSSFHEENFRPSAHNNNPAPVEQIPAYEPSYFQTANDQPTHHSSFFPSNNFQATGYSQESPKFPSLPPYKNPASVSASYPSHEVNSYATPQHRFDVSECGDDCGKPASAGVSSGIYNGQSRGKPFFHSGPGPAAAKSNDGTVPTRNGKTSAAFQSVPYATADTARTQSSTSSRFGPAISGTVHPNERSMLPPVAASDVYRSQLAFAGPRPSSMQDGNSNHHMDVVTDARQGTHFPNRPIPPEAYRYRAMIDDEVMQVPNWGFSTDELDLYRIAPNFEIDPNMLLLPTTPRTIPLEDLEDPVIRAFYSSMPDVGPLPTFRHIKFETPTYPQPKRPKPAAKVNPVPSKKPPQVPPTCAPCQAPPQQHNFNSCLPTGGYSNYQPIFLALPCYNPPVYQPMMPQLQIGYPNIAFAAPDYQHLGMASPLAVTHSHATSTPSPRSQVETHPGSTSSKQTDVRGVSLGAATPVTTPAQNSNESAESLEVNLAPKGFKVNNGNSSLEVDSSSAEKKEKVPEKWDGAKSKLNFTESIKQPETAASASTENVGALYSATTLSSADRVDNDQNNDGPTRTTFKSLFLTARKLAQLAIKDEDFNPYALDLTTPKSSPKRQRQVPKAMTNGSGSGKRKYAQ